MNPVSALFAPANHPGADRRVAPRPLPARNTRQEAAALSIPLCEVASVNGVGVMRSSASVAAESEPHVIELSPLQKIALLRMAGSTLCRGIATHLQNQNRLQDRPSIFDYRALVAQRLAYKPQGDDWHKITPEGMTLAREIARQIAQEDRIHIMIDHGNCGHLASYACACGKWSGSYQRGQFTSSNASRGFLRHCTGASETKEAESA